MRCCRKRVKRSKKALSDLPRDLIQEILDWVLMPVDPETSLFGYIPRDCTRSIWPVFRSVLLVPPFDTPPPVPIPWKNLRALECSATVAGKANLSLCKHMVFLSLFGDMVGLNHDFYPPNLISFHLYGTPPSADGDSEILPRVPLPLRFLDIDAKTFRLHNGSEYYAGVRHLTLRSEEPNYCKGISRVSDAFAKCMVPELRSLLEIELDGLRIVGLTKRAADFLPRDSILPHCRRFDICPSDAVDVRILLSLPALRSLDVVGDPLALLEFPLEKLRTLRIQNPQFEDLPTLTKSLAKCSRLEILHIIGGPKTLRALCMMPVQSTLLELYIDGPIKVPRELYLPVLKKLCVKANWVRIDVREWHMPELWYLGVDSCNVTLPVLLPKLEKAYLRNVPKKKVPSYEVKYGDPIVMMPMLNQLKIEDGHSNISGWRMPHLKVIILDGVLGLNWEKLQSPSVTKLWIHSYFPNIVGFMKSLIPLRTVLYSGGCKVSCLRHISRMYPNVTIKEVADCPEEWW